jgi:hypothetical protein
MTTGKPLRSRDAHILSAQLADRMDILVRLLLPNGNYGPGRRTYRCGSTAGEAGQSLCIWLDGPRRGRSRDYASGWYGNALDLVAAVLFRGDLGAALRWARDWLGLGSLNPESAEQLKRQTEIARQARQCQADRAAIHQADDAKRVWLAAAPLTGDDPAYRYLLWRGIDIGFLARPPAALRCHSALYNAESRRTWPALVAAICAPDGRHVNTHRIWLERHLDGRVTKAPIERPKLSMLGGYAGGCVRLWRGASGKSWEEMPEGETMLAGEGIEDTMTIICARPEWRAAAVLSVSSLVGFVLPPAVTRLVWIAQNDPAASSAAKAVAHALRVHREAGRTVAVIRSPKWVKDVNEFAQELGDAEEAT